MASQTANPNAPHEGLNRLVDRYWDEHGAIGDALAAQSLADSLAFERRFLAEVTAVPRASLDADSQLTYDIFKRGRELRIEMLTYPAELLPINPIDGPMQQFARAAAVTRERPLEGVKDYDNWLLRIDDQARWARQAIANMREGMRRGYTSPRVLMERALPQLQTWGEDSSENVFYSPLKTLPVTMADPDRTRLSVALKGAVKERLLPAYRGLHDFIQTEYLPRARLSLALSALPLGTSWYATLIKRATATQLTPDEIHAIGTAEVERLRTRLQVLQAATPPGGTPAAGASLLITAYQDLKVQTLAALPALFSLAPRGDLEIRAMPAPGAGGPPVLYERAAPGGATPAVLYVDTAAGELRPATVEIATFLQEAIPGRHFQRALQQERAGLPKFRRFGGDPGFQEGWALYAASLGEELGLYRDDAARRDALSGQLKCAAALVVDTGLQAKAWSKGQAVEYLRAQLALDDADANLMADRFLAMPADALACKMGELKFQALRSQAQQTLGARFDVREFHSEILNGGAMPLDILEAKIRLWMKDR